jgi:hypothetical protein
MVLSVAYGGNYLRKHTFAQGILPSGNPPYPLGENPVFLVMQTGRF